MAFEIDQLPVGHSQGLLAWLRKDALLSRYPDRRDRVTFIYSWAIRSRVRRINNLVRCASTSWVCICTGHSVNSSVMHHPDLQAGSIQYSPSGGMFRRQRQARTSRLSSAFVPFNGFRTRSALMRAASSSSHPASTFKSRPCGFGAPCQARRLIYASYAFMVLRGTSCAIGLSLDSVPLRTCAAIDPGRSLELHRRFLESIGDLSSTPFLGFTTASPFAVFVRS